MKTNYIRMKRLIPVLGIVVVAAGVMAGATYLDLARKIHNGEAFAATLGRLYQDQKLCAVLQTLQKGDVDEAARTLDLMLCDDVLAVHSRLALANPAERTYARFVFARIALLRLGNSGATVGAAGELSDDQHEAGRILAEAYAQTRPAGAEVAVSH